MNICAAVAVDGIEASDYVETMSIKPLIILPDPVLRQVSKPVERVDAPLLKLADDMLETMYDAPGIGLAAIQVGEPLRMLVIDLAKEGEKPAPQLFINPEIVASGEERSVYEEGCLSVPGIFGKVPRAAQITVEALNKNGERFTLDADGLLAVCIQHEMDHLLGKVFVEYWSQMKQSRIQAKFRKQRRKVM